MAEDAIEGEVTEQVGDLTEDDVNEYNDAIEEANKLLESGTDEATKQATDQKARAAQKIIYKILEIYENTPENSQYRQLLNDALENKSNVTLQESMKTWSDTFKEFTDEKGKQIKEKLTSTCKYLSDSARKVYSKYFTDPSNTAKVNAFDNANFNLQDAIDRNAPQLEIDALYDEVDKRRSALKEGVDNDTEGKKEGESKYGDYKMKILYLFLLAGGVIGALAIIAGDLNGCYQQSTKNSLKLQSCNSYYHQNKQNCVCGISSSIVDCTNPTFSMYPYCQCNEVSSPQQICTTGINYYYDNTNTPWSVLGDAYNTVKTIIEDAPKVANSLWDSIKKYAWIICIVLIVIVGLPFIIRAITFTGEVYHEIMPDGGEQTTSTLHHFKSKRKLTD